MRPSALSLFFSAGTVALCQSASTSPSNPQQNWLTPPELAQPGGDFTKLSPQWHFDSTVPIFRLVPGPLHQKDDPHIDPKIVVHPSQSSVGDQPPGTLVAQDLFPGLMVLPIQESQVKEQPIPTTWPDLRVQNIPIVWPKFDLKPAGSSASRPVARR
jgi:hypothetical protein